MGIPSYYKKLLEILPGLVLKRHPGQIDWLFMDFNCLIYHCLAHAPAYPGDAEKGAWEAAFIECVQTYCKKVISKVAPKKGVYIAIDGVVPMAKMRQQRLRRFKSAWMSTHDATAAKKWDTNAITPGTLFMAKLKRGLQEMMDSIGKKTWILSASDEPGEGEHKIMAAWRTGSYTGSFAVYGLDADLIVLSLIGKENCILTNPIWLFREEVVAGKMSYDADHEEIFEWFSIDKLGEWLVSHAASINPHTFMLNYGCAMSVLGNDFLPRSLGLTLRDDGHGELLSVLQTLLIQGIVLVNPDTLALSTSGLRSFFECLSITEAPRMAAVISKKQMFARQLGATVPLEGDDAWPLYHMEEDVLLMDKKQLIPSWKDKYLHTFFPGYARGTLCSDYLYGIQWIWAYYTGKDVCFNWYYPHALPPLWEWLREEAVLPDFPGSIEIRAADIRCVEQLALVLPLESWSLIPPCKERQLPLIAPHFFPSTFSFDPVGKRFFWECESLIPLLSIKELKALITI